MRGYITTARFYVCVEVDLIKSEHSKHCKFCSMRFVECSKNKYYDINTNFITDYLWLFTQKL